MGRHIGHHKHHKHVSPINANGAAGSKHKKTHPANGKSFSADAAVAGTSSHAVVSKAIQNPALFSGASHKNLLTKSDILTRYVKAHEANPELTLGTYMKLNNIDKDTFVTGAPASAKKLTGKENIAQVHGVLNDVNKSMYQHRGQMLIGKMGMINDFISDMLNPGIAKISFGEYLKNKGVTPAQFLQGLPTPLKDNKIFSMNHIGIAKWGQKMSDTHAQQLSDYTYAHGSNNVDTVLNDYQSEVPAEELEQPAHNFYGFNISVPKTTKTISTTTKASLSPPPAPPPSFQAQPPANTQTTTDSTLSNFIKKETAPPTAPTTTISTVNTATPTPVFNEYNPPYSGLPVITPYPSYAPPMGGGGGGGGVADDSTSGDSTDSGTSPIIIYTLTSDTPFQADEPVVDAKGSKGIIATDNGSNAMTLASLELADGQTELTGTLTGVTSGATASITEVQQAAPATPASNESSDSSIDMSEMQGGDDLSEYAGEMGQGADGLHYGFSINPHFLKEIGKVGSAIEKDAGAAVRAVVHVVNKFNPATFLMRAAFGGLVDINAFGMAGNIGKTEDSKNGKHWGDIKGIWTTFGGDTNNLSNMVSRGRNKHPFLASGEEYHNVTGFDDAATVAAAAPITASVAPVAATGAATAAAGGTASVASIITAGAGAVTAVDGLIKATSKATGGGDTKADPTTAAAIKDLQSGGGTAAVDAQQTQELAAANNPLIKYKKPILIAIAAVVVLGIIVMATRKKSATN